MKKIKRFHDAKSELFKFENARVGVLSIENDNAIEYGVKLKVLTDNLEPRARHFVEKDKIVTTTVRLSQEAAISLMYALCNQLRKDGVPV